MNFNKKVEGRGGGRPGEKKPGGESFSPTGGAEFWERLSVEGKQVLERRKEKRREGGGGGFAGNSKHASKVFPWGG